MMVATISGHDFDLKEKSLLPVRPQEFQSDQLQQLFDQDLPLGIERTAITKRLQAMGNIWKVGKWVPEELFEAIKTQWLNTCLGHLARNQKRVFCGNL